MKKKGIFVVVIINKASWKKSSNYDFVELIKKMKIVIILQVHRWFKELKSIILSFPINIFFNLLHMSIHHQLSVKLHLKLSYYLRLCHTKFF